MPSRPASVFAALAILGATISLSAQQVAASARLVRAEGRVTLNGQPVPAGAATVTLGEVTDLQTTEGRVVIALKGGGTFVLGANTSARVHANRVYNFNRIEILTGSAVLLSASSSPQVDCGTSARLSSGGVFRFDVLAAERMDGSQRCRVRVYEGGASTPGVTVSYVLRDGQEMIMNTRAGDMIPVSPVPAGVLDDLDRWAREQAVSSR